MKTENGRYFFGFWEGMPYKTVTDRYEDYVKFKNVISKAEVIRHIEALDNAVASAISTDIFTGEKFNAGLYDDGVFTFPVDFLRYYKSKDIGIPPEYEKYLSEIL